MLGRVFMYIDYQIYLPRVPSQLQLICTLIIKRLLLLRPQMKKKNTNEEKKHK